VLVQPLLRAGQGKLIYTDIFEAFFVQVKVALFAALMLSFPVLATQLWRFVAPGLYSKEKNAFLPFLLLTPVFFAGGASFAYFVAMPWALHFLLSFQGNIGGVNQEALPGVGNYLNFVTRFLFGFGAAFLWNGLSNVHFFFFGSMYFQIAVGQKPTQAGFSILTMFYSFFVASRIGGGWMDKDGAKKPVSIGFLLGTIGMAVWANKLTDLGASSTVVGMLITGAGFGLVFSPLNTDALNRLPDSMRGQGSGIIQTFRNFGSAIGMAVMGSIVAGAGIAVVALLFAGAS